MICLESPYSMEAYFRPFLFRVPSSKFWVRRRSHNFVYRSTRQEQQVSFAFGHAIFRRMQRSLPASLRQTNRMFRTRNYRFIPLPVNKSFFAVFFTSGLNASSRVVVFYCHLYRQYLHPYFLRGTEVNQERWGALVHNRCRCYPPNCNKTKWPMTNEHLPPFKGWNRIIFGTDLRCQLSDSCRWTDYDQTAWIYLTKYFNRNFHDTIWTVHDTVK